MRNHNASAFLGAGLSFGCLLFITGCFQTKTQAVGAGHTWRVVPQAGVDAKFLVSGSEGSEPNGELPWLFFWHEEDERRLVPLEVSPITGLTGAKALELDYHLRAFEDSATPRPAVVVFDDRGGAWFTLGDQPLVARRDEDDSVLRSGETTSKPGAELEEEPESFGFWTSARLPLRSFQRAEFSQADDATPDLDTVDTAWVALLYDGPAKGILVIQQARFTDEPFRPTKPLQIPVDDVGRWSLSKDPAVRGKISTPEAGPGGKPCMRFEFAFPLGRHMFGLPILPLPPAEYDGYSALRFTYRAKLPQGIDDLLVSLFEHGGGQYIADPSPTPTAEWQTVTIPLTSFRLGEWSRDPDAGFDVASIDRLSIGLHRTATGGDGKGSIEVAGIEFVP